MKRRLIVCASMVALAGSAGCGSCGAKTDATEQSSEPSPSASQRPFRVAWDGGIRRLHLRPRDGGLHDGGGAPSEAIPTP